MRKLAHIEVIEKIDPIPDADSIEVAQVLGWKCVIKKGEFSVGDKVIYIEVDSILPDKPEFEFLRPRGFRIRTIKLRKQISQGLILSVKSLPEGYKGSLRVGTDVTDALEITKYESSPELADNPKRHSPFHKFMMRFNWYRKLFSKPRSSFPNWITKTEEERIQNIPHVLDQYKGKPFDITEKLDGQSATYFLRKKGFGYEFGVCSRNHLLPTKDSSSWWSAARKYNIEGILKDIIGDSDSVVLQGEILGTGVQKNKYKVSDYKFYAFNLTFPDFKCSWEEMADILWNKGIDCVPLIMKNVLLPETVDELVSLSSGKSVLLNSVEREGLVVRSKDGRLSFKVISPTFLLKNNE